MSEHIQKTITELKRHLTELEDEAIDTKNTINSLCRRIGQPPLFPDADLKRSNGITSPMRGDEYYGKPLATVVRWVLESRQAANLGPATVNEIYDTMVQGGYQFQTTNAENAKRGLRISLAKNTSTFHKLPTGKFGLIDWYPAIKEMRPNGKTADKELPNGECDEDDALPVGVADTSEELIELDESKRKPK